MLLTCDEALRKMSECHSIEGHGGIWVLDQLVEQGHLVGGIAAEKL
ncbi:MAG: hypothetical protein PF795_06845 [Kiritimatiellae bacterium]|nr:hypothetical protein [Kiritimatiellia bacterium]